MTTGSLQEHHLKDLQASGLDADSIARAGLYSVTATTARLLIGFARSGGLAFPYKHTAVDGGDPTYTRIKFDKPDAAGKRYCQAKGSGNRLYIPPTLDPDTLKDPAAALFITEGEKKAIKAVQEGLSCVSVSGVDSWRTRSNSGKSEPIKDLDLVEWQDRQVYLVYDSDLATNTRVLWAEFNLAQELTSRGAKVEAIRLPAGSNGEKVGLDDYLITHSVDTFCGLDPIPITHPDVTPVLPPTETLDVFLAREIRSVPSLVGDGLIVEKGLHTLIGPKGKGKTSFTIQTVLTTAGGLEYLLIPELIVHRAIPVLYLNLEMPEAVFESRLQQQVREALWAGYNMQKAWPNFRRLTLRGKMRLDKKDGRELLVKLVRETKAKLVVIDNLGATMSVDSNSDERMAPIFLSLYEICEAEDVAILLVLHTPKDVGERDEVYWARGSSIQADRADTIMTIKPYGNEEHGIQRRIGLHLRSGPEVDPIIVTRQRGSLIWTAGKQKDVRLRWLRDYLREEREAPYQDVLAAFEGEGHGKDRVFRQALQKLGPDVHTRKEGFGADSRRLIQWVGN